MGVLSSERVPKSCELDDTALVVKPCIAMRRDELGPVSIELCPLGKHLAMLLAQPVDLEATAREPFLETLGVGQKAFAPAAVHTRVGERHILSYAGANEPFALDG